ncbi:MAG: hypothetical protein PVI40_08015 [Chlamydiota bacterium]|jgi:hypothetical protein
MSIESNPHLRESSNQSSIYQLHSDAEASFFQYLDPESLKNFGTASSETLDRVLYYIKPKVQPFVKIQDFIDKLLLKLEPVQHQKQILTLKMIKESIHDVTSKLEPSDFPGLSSLIFLLKKPSVFRVKELIIQELVGLDSLVIENLKQISEPKVFENFFEVLELTLRLVTKIRAEGLESNLSTVFKEYLIGDGKLDVALEAAEMLSCLYRYTALQGIFQTLLEADEIDKVLELISRQLLDFYSIKNGFEFFINARKWDKALKIVPFIPDNRSEDWKRGKDNFFVTTNTALTEAGKWDEAVAVARLIFKEKVRNSAFTNISRALIASGEIRKGVEVTKFIVRSRFYILINEISKSLYEEGEKDKALKVLHQTFEHASSISNELIKENVFCWMAKLLYKMGEKELANKIIPSSIIFHITRWL